MATGLPLSSCPTCHVENVVCLVLVTKILVNCLRRKYNFKQWSSVKVFNHRDTVDAEGRIYVQKHSRKKDKVPLHLPHQNLSSGSVFLFILALFLVLLQQLMQIM